MRNFVLYFLAFLCSSILSNKCYSHDKDSIFIKIDHLESVNRLDIELFMSYFDDSYDDNIEISENRNEMLFKLLSYVNPCLFIKTLSTQSENIINSIFFNIRHPINDQIDISKVLRNINLWKTCKTKSRDNFALYEELVNALRYPTK